MIESDFNPFAVIEVLARHRVEFVLIGGLAANARGSDVNTNDLDICYRRSPANYEALASALREIGATLRGAPAGLPFLLDAKTIRNGDSFTFDTQFGKFDCLGTPSGTSGYDDLIRNATTLTLGEGNDVPVCSIDDLIRMKRAAARPKDLYAVEHLTALKKLIESGAGNS